VRITYKWDPPAGTALQPIEDAVTLTVVELDYIAGRHGTGDQPSNLLGDRKTTFLKTEAEQLEDVLANEITLNDLPTANFGGVRLRGLDLAAIAELTARTADEREHHGAAAPEIDATLPTDLTREAPASRVVISTEDLMVYTGNVSLADGTTLSPQQVRAAFKPQLALPLQTTEDFLADTAVQQRLIIRSAVGLHPPLIGGAAGPAAIEIIDALAFRQPISDGVRDEDLLNEYLAFVSTPGSAWVGRDGALADRWSRLIIRVVLPPLDPHTAFDFRLTTDPESDEPLVGSNHVGDEVFPFGMLSLTGFEGFNAEETYPVGSGPDGPGRELHDVRVRVIPLPSRQTPTDPAAPAPSERHCGKHLGGSPPAARAPARDLRPRTDRHPRSLG
jgi:hypothetical protein